MTGAERAPETGEGRQRVGKECVSLGYGPCFNERDHAQAHEPSRSQCAMSEPHCEMASSVRANL
jgi:hypothetical protein